MITPNTLKNIIPVFFILLVLPACTNQSRSKGLIKGQDSIIDILRPTGSSTNGLKISNLFVEPDARPENPPNVSIYLVASGTPITNFCSTDASGAATTNPCFCQFSWTEINDSTGSSISVPRKTVTSVTTVQPAAVFCKAPEIFNSEIVRGTPVKITLVPAANNPKKFTLDPYIYLMQPVTSISETPDFRDSEGTGFISIRRYTCYETIKKGVYVENKRLKISPMQVDQQVVMSSKFSIAKRGIPGSRDSVLSSNGNSPTLSHESNYFNLYMPSSSMGSIQPSNNYFACPNVGPNEHLQFSVTENNPTQQITWPMDATFALATHNTPTFRVPVESPSVLGNSRDTTTLPTSCDPKVRIEVPEGLDGMIANKCIGFAKPPNADGTCSPIHDASGVIRPTFRLRRYIAHYPAQFESTGDPYEGVGRQTDIIYVLDRPVNSGDPARPYTMLGPKPCGYAYYASAYILGNQATYASTNDPRWLGINVDGSRFPNVDQGPSCGAAMPITALTTNSANATLAISHINSDGVWNNRVAGMPGIKLGQIDVRGIRPWYPQYDEDTDFLACAPQPKDEGIVDPPIHFYKDASGQMSWCSMVYPNFISTSLNTNLPGVAQRTAHFPIPGYFPLNAKTGDIENMMTKDSNFQCKITWDSRRGKLGKTPSGGCCGARISLTNNSGAQLEPGTKCPLPVY